MLRANMDNQYLLKETQIWALLGGVLRELQNDVYILGNFMSHCWMMVDFQS